MTTVKWLRLSVLLICVGIVTELISVVSLTPPTFLAFVIVGIPCMALGVLIYVVHVARHLRKTGAL